MSTPDTPPGDVPTPPASEPVSPPNEQALECTIHPATVDAAAGAEGTESEEAPEATACIDAPAETEATENVDSAKTIEASDAENKDGAERTKTINTEDAEGIKSEGETPDLVLPKWFLDNNVVLFEELRVAPPRLDVFHPGGNVNETETEATKPIEQDTASVVDYEVHQSLYDEAQDMIFSGIQHSGASAAPSSVWADDVAFLVQSPKKGALEFLDAVVHHLARDFGADLVSLDREDLEDLCHHFWSASERAMAADTYLNVPYRFVQLRFDKYDGNEVDTLAAAATIVRGPETKRLEGKLEATITSRSEKPRPVIVLLRDVEAYDMQTPFKRFRDVVKARRAEGQRILIVATAVSDSTAEFKQRTYAMDKVWEGLDLDSSTVINISPQPTKKSAEALQRNIDQAIPQARWRQLRRALRHSLQPEIMSDALSPSTEWSFPDIDDVKQTVEDWDNAIAARVIRQISARARRASTLEMNDIFDVMGRVSRNKTIFNKSNDDLTSLGDSDESNEGGSRVRLLLDKIASKCSDDEKRFFDCVIDTDAITATTEGIHMDSGIIGSLHQLLSLRTHKSYGLLAQESVNGAILYGPPGTGKTHLARVVAKTAGTNLIVATPADIQSCFVGETEQRIKALFSLGVKLGPCVIFLDEGDSIFTRRTSGDKDWTRKAMSQFLMEMDGLCKVEQPPFILVATNRPNDMDDAVCRRLPHMLHIGMPSAEDRKAIFDIYLREEQVGDDVDFAALAATATKGFSGSDIRTLCVQAAMAAQGEIDLFKVNSDEKNAEAPRRIITKSHFDKALSRTRPSVTRESLLEIQKFASQQRRSR